MLDAASHLPTFKRQLKHILITTLITKDCYKLPKSWQMRSGVEHPEYY